MTRITEKGKKHALKELERRQKENKSKKRIDNSKLPAGAPMYYYCESCGHQMVLSEDHSCPAPSHCKECQALIDRGWLE